MLALLLTACAPCTPFHAMELDEPEALGPIVADFAAWSGRDGVCVPSVLVVPLIDGERVIAGQYQGAGAPILLKEAPDYRVSLFHELCHALDQEEGLSEGDPDPGDVIDPIAYPSPELRRKEAFAQVCGRGPAAVSFEDALAARCDLVVDEALARVRAVAFPEAPPDPRVTVGPDPTRATLDGLAEGDLLAAAGRPDGAWLRLGRGAERWVEWWSAGEATGAAEPAVGPTAWATSDDTVVGPHGAALWLWDAHGIAGAAVGDDEAYAITTDCTLSSGGGLPAWVGDTPTVFVGYPERARFHW